MLGCNPLNVLAQSEQGETMTKEALKLALEALKMADELCRGHGVDFKEYGLEFDRDIQVKYKDAITAIKEALAQPERDYERGFIDGMQKQMQSSVDKAVNRMAQPEQEFVAWEQFYPDIGKPQIALDQKAENARELGLDYGWVGLTDEEIEECLKGLPTQTVDVYARRIEQALKEKNT